MAEPAAPEGRTTTAQAVWLAVYWCAAGANFLLMTQAIIYAASFTFTNIVAVVLAFVSTLIGAIFATRILRHRVSTTVFVRSTTTVRVIAIAWNALIIAIISGTLISTFFGIDTSDADWSAGFAGTVGSISLLAILGPAYKEYREAIAPE